MNDNNDFDFDEFTAEYYSKNNDKTTDLKSNKKKLTPEDIEDHKQAMNILCIMLCGFIDFLNSIWHLLTGKQNKFNFLKDVIKIIIK